MIVLLRQVDHAERAQLGAHHALHGQHRIVVGQMSDARHDPALQRPRIGPHPQHVEIMIRLEEQAVAAAQMAQHGVVDISEVAGDADAGAVARLDHEA